LQSEISTNDRDQHLTEDHGGAIMRIPSTFIAITLLLSSAYADGTNDSYVQRIQAGRIEKETDIKSKDGFLSYIGSYRLKEGENRVGSDPANEILLPAGSAPAEVGKFILTNGRVTFTSSTPGLVSLNGQAVSTADLDANKSRPSAKLSVGRLQLFYRLSADLERRVFISDPQSPNFANFQGLDWYPIDEDWRIQGKFVPHQNPQRITYENALGGSNIANSPGDVVFTRNGREYRLEVGNVNNSLVVLFSDETSGKSTYGGGRTLQIEKGVGDAVILDFNQAANQPCAVNPYTACSLSPSQNRLAFSVTAGEKNPRMQVERVAAAPKRIQ
jgi:uncharacterized protein (DUF1684 family)